ncbi:MAG: glycogen synthase [Desulfurivibrio sp.]|nr:MAG: glycogen synthase [Desulfurivibrio sp.]
MCFLEYALKHRAEEVSQMKVLYIAAECKPFSKVGGVGDVAGELPVALKQEGVEVEIVTPWYGRTKIDDRKVDFHGNKEPVGIVHADLMGVPVNFVKNPTYFETDYTKLPDNQPRPFTNPYLFKKDYSTPYVNSDTIAFYDDALRFSFFSAACLSLIEDKKPDIVHVNDWGLGYLLGNMAIRKMRQKRVLTIHNIGYQGTIGKEAIRGWDMERILQDDNVGPLFVDPHTEWNSVNALRLALELADYTNTVSPNYKDEITQPENKKRYFEGGKGLHSVTSRLANKGRLHGILNGFEYQIEPTDRSFKETLTQKAKMKQALGKEFENPGAFLLGFVGRAVEQKFKLLAEELDGKSVLEHILDIPGVNVAVVATGEERYELFLSRFVDRPNLSVTIAFDREKARQISLGSDVFLMPSLFEPCGITQMESLSCATPPLVRWTGGLVDTVKPHTADDGTGFGFDGQTSREVLTNLVASVHDALKMYTKAQDGFRNLQWRGFRQRFLWATAARRYVNDIYEPTLRM